MKIAMILRPDADTVFGGDTVVMNKLSHAMRGQGVEVVVGPLDVLPPASEFDLLHIFTVAPLTHARRMVAWAQAGRVPIVFSPLYYATFRHWFEKASASAPRWRRLAATLGKERTWAIYRTWQEVKLPLVEVWRESRKVLAAATCIATSSQWENRYVAGHFRLSRRIRQQMRISPLGIDAALYGQTFSDEQIAAFRARHQIGPGYVCEVARLEPKKNQLAVIEALAGVDVPLVFVGHASPYAPGYVARCREAGARRGQVHFLNWLPEEELPLLYAAAAAHILPSWVELPGLSSLEAGASGCRVISTEISPLPELLGDQAWYCDPFDQGSIRAAVLAALDTPAPPGLRQRLLTNLSWERAAAANLALYRQTISAQTSLTCRVSTRVDL